MENTPAFCFSSEIIKLIDEYKKSEPSAYRLKVRISHVWWSIGDSNWPRVIPRCPILCYPVVLCCHIEQIRHTQSHVIPPG